MGYRLARWFAILIARAMFAICGGVRIEGAERVPVEGPVIIAPNHISDSDPFAVGMALPRSSWWMGKSELFRIPMLSWFMRILHGFPVRRGKPDREALRKAESVLRLGEALVIFPEGRISETGDMQELNPGVVMIAMRTGAPIVPVGLVNTNRVIPFRKLIPRRSPKLVEVRFGEPIPVLELIGGLSGRAALERGVERLSQAIRELAKGDSHCERASFMARRKPVVP